ncbi:uncharacterized protein LOC132731612 isoform X2 [Ruditapes philippinarum]|nr:uncharacterized protein LOC132731612 isoform X2 [Ruditapes philippinarum]
MPNYAMVIYVLVLVMDLIVGGSIILWKCYISKSEEECELATGGALGSIIIWLMIMLVCPCFATRIEICLTLDNLKKKCIQYTRKTRDIVIQNEANNSTTTTLLSNGQDSKPHLRSNVYIFNETQGKGDLSTKLQAAHIPKTPVLLTNGLTNTTDVKYQQDVP